MLNADRVSAGDSLKLIVSGSQIHKKTNYSETKQGCQPKLHCEWWNIYYISSASDLCCESQVTGEKYKLLVC